MHLFPDAHPLTLAEPVLSQVPLQSSSISGVLLAEPVVVAHASVPRVPNAALSEIRTNRTPRPFQLAVLDCQLADVGRVTAVETALTSQFVVVGVRTPTQLLSFFWYSMRHPAAPPLPEPAVQETVNVRERVDWFIESAVGLVLLEPVPELPPPDELAIPPSCGFRTVVPKFPNEPLAVLRSVLIAEWDAISDPE